MEIFENREEIMTEKEKNYHKKNWKKESEKVLKIIIKDRDLLTLQSIIEGQKEEIERLHNIIKEVREYIKEACWLDEVNKPNSLGHKQTMKVLEILDKENI